MQFSVAPFRWEDTPFSRALFPHLVSLMRLMCSSQAEARHLGLLCCFESFAVTDVSHPDAGS